MSDPTTEAIERRAEEIERLRRDNKELRDILQKLCAAKVIEIDPNSDAGPLIGLTPKPEPTLGEMFALAYNNLNVLSGHLYSTGDTTHRRVAVETKELLSEINKSMLATGLVPPVTRRGDMFHCPPFQIDCVLDPYFTIGMDNNWTSMRVRKADLPELFAIVQAVYRATRGQAKSPADLATDGK